MRDAFLIFLLVIAVALLGGYAWLAVWVIRRNAASDGDGCGVSCGLGIIGGLVLVAVLSILAVVGHAVGVNMSDLTGG